MPGLLAQQAPNWFVRLVGVHASRLALVLGRRLKNRHRCRVGIVHGCDQSVRNVRTSRYPTE